MPKCSILYSMLLLAAVGRVAMAGTNYDVTVSRKSSNVYEVSGSQIRILTRYCYEYAYSKKGLLDWSGYGGYLIFLDQGNKCDVRKIVGLSDIRVGKYDIHVTRDEDDWYAIGGTDLYIETSLCLELALSEEAILNWDGVGGDLIFLNSGRKCRVENTWGKV